MTHKLIKTDNYLLVVDDSEIKIGDHFYDNDGEVCKYDELYVVDPNDFNDNQKIIAHLPINGSPILEGVDLLPPIEDYIEDLAKGEVGWYDKNDDYEIKAFINGYNKAKEKYKYTEEDIRKAIEMARPQGFRRSEGYLVKHTDEEIIQSLSQYPTEFETEDVKDYSSTPKEGIELSSFLVPKTITTAKGIQWVGKYK